MDQKDIQSLIVISSTILITFTIVLVSLFVVFQRRKASLITKNLEDERKFNEELNRMQIEVKEQTLRNISWELHDNIGQLLTLAKIQLQNVENEDKTVEQVGETITKSIQELRSLSRLINPEVSKKLDLYDSVNEEIERLNRLNFIEATCALEGSRFVISYDKQIIFFRIIQEFITNTIKHAKATKLDIAFNYTCDTLTIKARDNGIGFDMDADSYMVGQGLENMKNRAKLIGAEVKLNSVLGDETSLQLTYSKPVIHE